VIFKDRILHFPHWTSGQPIRQAEVHAKHVEDFLYRKTGKHYPVKPVVALPGWHVDTKAENFDVLVINPKNGCKVLKKIVPMEEAEIIANHIDEFSRTVKSSIDMTDPDGGKKYSLLLNRKKEDRIL
jgi:hypothetical protein